MAAFGDNERESDGFLRSQSTSNVFAPVCAVSRASATAMLDLPSFGIDDVKPMILQPVPD